MAISAGVSAETALDSSALNRGNNSSMSASPLLVRVSRTRRRSMAGTSRSTQPRVVRVCTTPVSVALVMPTAEATSWLSRDSQIHRIHRTRKPVQVRSWGRSTSRVMVSRTAFPARKIDDTAYIEATSNDR